MAAALTASAAVAGALPTLGGTGPGTLILETWRIAGLGVFAGLFALLAYRPHRYPGVWALIIAHKLVLLVALTAAPGTTDASVTATVDGTTTLC